MSENKGYTVNSSGAGFYGEASSQDQSISMNSSQDTPLDNLYDKKP